MYSTRTRVHARIPNGHPRKENQSARVRGQVGEDRRACSARSWRAERAARAAAGRLCRARRTRRLPRREDPRAEVGEDVRVGVGPGGI